MSMESFSDTIGNRTDDLLAFNAVSQPTAQPRSAEILVIIIIVVVRGGGVG